MKNIKIYTDGASRGNGSKDALGGFGVVMLFDKPNGETFRKEFKYFQKGVTNNHMELKAVVYALYKLKEPCKVNLFSDSKYVCDAISKSWLPKWVRNGWMTGGKKPVANRELWEMLVPLLEKHDVTFNWVKGHATNKENNRCDELANIAIDEYLGGR